MNLNTSRCDEKLSIKFPTPGKTNTKRGEKYKERVKDVSCVITVPINELDMSIKEFCMDIKKSVHKLNKKIDWKII